MSEFGVFGISEILFFYFLSSFRMFELFLFLYFYLGRGFMLLK